MFYSAELWGLASFKVKVKVTGKKLLSLEHFLLTPKMYHGLKPCELQDGGFCFENSRRYSCPSCPCLKMTGPRLRGHEEIRETMRLCVCATPGGGIDAANGAEGC